MPTTLESGFVTVADISSLREIERKLMTLKTRRVSRRRWDFADVDLLVDLTLKTFGKYLDKWVQLQVRSNFWSNVHNLFIENLLEYMVKGRSTYQPLMLKSIFPEHTSASKMSNLTIGGCNGFKVDVPRPTKLLLYTAFDNTGGLNYLLHILITIYKIDGVEYVPRSV